MSRSIEHKVMTRSATKYNFTAKNSNTPELRRSKRISRKNDEESLTDVRTHTTPRLNDTKRTKYQHSTLCNKSRLKKGIARNIVVKKQQDYKIAKSKPSGTILIPSDNNDIQITSGPSTFENNLRLQVISDNISERDADMKLNTPLTIRHDLVTASEVQNNDFCPSPKNLEELSIILNKIWDRQQLKELDDDAI